MVATFNPISANMVDPCEVGAKMPWRDLTHSWPHILKFCMNIFCQESSGESGVTHDAWMKMYNAILGQEKNISRNI